MSVSWKNGRNLFVSFPLYLLQGKNTKMTICASKDAVDEKISSENSKVF